MKMYSWKYAQFSQFNESDTLLLVSGIHSAKLHTISGVIAVFNLEGNLHRQFSRVLNIVVYIATNQFYHVYRGLSTTMSCGQQTL